jgi:phosphoribosyl-ATP pyrophosphohydrolase/phosphoribosyl-AMP cyclohydrolase
MKPDFSKSPEGLVPAVVQDNKSGRVLMLGYMNEAAFNKTQAEKRVTFFSRSKQRLWTKGEESGNFLELKELLIDCDSDTLLLKVNPLGPVCHTGTDTCFAEKNTSINFLGELEEIIRERKKNPSGTSYTSSLFSKGINKVAQKVGEEAVELVIEAMDSNDPLFLEESADLMFHYLILLCAKGFTLEDVLQILKNRQKR